MRVPDKGKMMRQDPLCSSRERRDFLKTCGMATAGGLSALVLSGAGPAEAWSSGAAMDTAAAAPEGTGGELYWRFVRSRFSFERGLTYLNTGTLGSMPVSVQRALGEAQQTFNSNPCYCLGYDDELKQTQVEHRQRVAAFLGAEAAEIVMTANTTEGLHLAFAGLDLEQGDEILTTMHEFPSGFSQVHQLRDRKGVVVTKLELPSPAPDKQAILDLFDAAITGRTKVISFCHINYTTGLRMPVRELCDLARSKNIISIVDGAHGPGMIDFSLHDLGCDIYAGSGHKWLCGPPGTGIFYVRDAESNPCGLWPIITESYEYRNYLSIADLLQNRGQQNTPAFSGLTAAIAFQESIGRKRIQTRVLELHNYAKERIIDAWGEDSLLSPLQDDDLSSGLISFIPFADRYTRKCNEVFNQLMDDYNTYVRAVWFKENRDDPDPVRAVRLSTHIFNSFEQIDRAVEAMKRIADSLQ